MTTPNPHKLKIDSIKAAIFGWVSHVVGTQVPEGRVVWRNQSQPLPPRPCVALKIEGGPVRTGFSDSIMFFGGTEYLYAGQRKMTVSVEVFGSLRVERPRAFQLALDLNSSLSLESVLERLRARGVAVFDQGEVLNLTELEETEYEERAEFTVTLGVAENQIENPGIIETANITPNVSGP